MRGKTWRLVSIAVLAAALSVFAAGCGGGDEEAAAPPPAPPAEPAEPPPAETGATDTGATDTGATGTPVECAGTFGFIGPLTGDAATIGQDQLNWAKFAISQWNAEHGSTFELVEEDDQLDSAVAATVAAEVAADDSILATVGPAGSPQVLAAADSLDGVMAYVSGSSTQTDITLNHETFFRTVPTDDDQGPTDATFMIETLGAKKVLVIDDQESYSQGLADATQAALEEGGVEVVRESVGQSVTDFSALVSGITDDTDVVFIPWQLAANAQLFADQMAEQGKTAALMGGDGLDSADLTADGVYFSTFAPDIRTIDDPDIQAIVDAYTTEVAEDFSTFGPPSYLAAQVLAVAAQSICDAGGELTREAMIEALHAVNLPTSILGSAVAFDEHGDITPRQFYVFQIQGDQKVVVS